MQAEKPFGRAGQVAIQKHDFVETCDDILEGQRVVVITVPVGKDAPCEFLIRHTPLNALLKPIRHNVLIAGPRRHFTQKEAERGEVDAHFFHVLLGILNR